MKPRFSFKKGKEHIGMMRLPKTVELRYGGEKLATIQQLRNSDQWFWYGMGINTARTPSTLEECKKQALETALAAQQAHTPPEPEKMR